MGLLQNWFGFESIEKDIQKELDLIENILTEIIDTEKVLKNKTGRKKKLDQILAVQKGALDKGIDLVKKLEQKLQQYLSGEKKTENLMGVLILQNMLRDLRNDPLWLELRDLWTEEYSLLESGDETGLRKNLLHQKHIAECLKQITELEFNETHMHAGMSVDPVFHWNYLKKQWKKSVEGKTDKEHDIRLLYKNNELISKDDKRQIKKIMDNYFSGKWNEVQAFVAFEELLIMHEDISGCFHDFNRKAEIMNVIQSSVHDTPLAKKFYAEAFERIVQHNLAHNITHIEIRFPTHNLGFMKDFADIAKELEEKYDNRITIRFVEFVIHQDPRPFFEAYKAAPKEVKKYIVAVDVVGKHEDGWAIELARESPIPVCVHAGEFFSQKDFPDRTPAENVEHALREVERALSIPKIFRLGHANVIGLNIKEYLHDAKPKKVERLIALQQKLIDEIKKKGVVVESNPTSNVKIRGITYEEHPIAAFVEKDIPFAISTDDRVTFDTTLKKEFFRIARVMRWKEKEIALAAKMQKEAKLH